MNQACIPIALQIVIDDVGWWSGKDSSKQGGPYRTGFARDHVPADYQAIIELGRRLNMRPQAAMILCEWDRTNSLQSLPSATWMGAKWDNPYRHSLFLDEASEMLRLNSKHLEIALHGVGHEFWADGVMTRSEWGDGEGHMRPEHEVRAHIEAFRRIMEENELGPFPKSFVPPAARYQFGVEKGTAFFLAEAGIHYASPPFNRYLFKARPPEAVDFGVDYGILTVDRPPDRFPWYAVGPVPEGEVSHSVFGMHWPNLLHLDPERNLEVIERWVQFFLSYATRFDGFLGEDTASAFSQLVYHRWALVACDDRQMTLDFKRVDALRARGLQDRFVVKIKAKAPLKLEAHGVTILDQKEEVAGQWRVLVQREHGRSTGRIEWH